MSILKSALHSELRLSEIAHWMEARLEGEDRNISGITTDSRILSENELFFALVGEHVNGHDFIEEVARKNAAGVVVSQTVKSETPRLYVKDTGLALGQMGKHYRDKFNLPVAAITGSYGKTTVKEMLASILSVGGKGLATQGNLNTEVGVPLTLLRLAPEHRWAVIEMGARKTGDIGYLMEIAKPTVAFINNAGIAHIEIFGSEFAIRNAKGELYQGLREDGIAVINIEDPHFPYWKSLLKGQTIFSFGKSPLAQLRVDEQKCYSQSSSFNLYYGNDTVHISLSVPGEHNLRNACGAAAMALAMGATLSQVQQGLERFQSVKGRLQFIKGFGNSKIIDDTYNANPVSMRAALSVLASQREQKYFVMGDMLELGEHAESWHQDMGEEARRLGIHKMFGFGPLTHYAVREFGENARYYQDKQALIQDLSNELKEMQALGKETTVLVKGSRGMRMEEVVAAIASQNHEH